MCKASTYMQSILNCEEEKKMNGTTILNLLNLNGDLCANGNLSSSYSFK